MLQTPPAACAGENLSVTADAHNWLHATGGPGYQYDAAGNMTFNATPPTQNYTYDQENRLIGAAGYAYTYDADGNRAIKSNGSTGTLYWHMTPGIVGESDLSGNLTDEYVFFDGERVARKGTNGVFYYFSDHLKTASVITDAPGTIKAESDYYPWGGELQFVANDSNHYKFTGKERDGETQLDYFGARYYSNGLGRFVTPDWAAKATAVPYAEFSDPQSLNLYTYVRNIPTTKYDADGHCTGDDCNKITVTAEKVGEPTMTLRASGQGQNSAEVVGTVLYTVTYNGNPLTKTQMHEQVKATTTKNGTAISPPLKTGSAKTDGAGQVVDKVSIGATGKAQPPFANSAAHELTTNAFTEKQTQVLTLESPSGSTCKITETRTLTNADASGKGSEKYTLTLNSPTTQTAKPAQPPKPKENHSQ